jgi:dTDP-4-dehydrorhamnose reductase
MGGTPDQAHVRDDSGRALVPNEDARLLVLGAGGMLGRALTATCSAHGLNWVGAGRGSMDLAETRSIRRDGADWVPRGGVVVNCAAWTDVDGAEKDEAGAMAVNAVGVGVLAEVCRERGAVLVHFGTDYVFDGQGTRPYTVDHPIAPLGAYGRTKAAGERAIAEAGCEHLMIRTSWLHAAWGKNFVRTIAGLCLSRAQIKVVSDQVGRPTSCWHLASATLGLLLAGARGIVHVTDGGEPTSWHGFASEIAGHVRRRWGPACEVLPCTTAEFPRPAKRPAYSVLDLSSAEAKIGPRPDWRVGLAEVMATMEKPG